MQELALQNNSNPSYAALKMESDSLVSYVNSFSEKLPQYDVALLSQRLKVSVKSLTEHLDHSLNGTSKLDKVRYWIRLSIAIKECKETLDIIEQLKYGDTKSIMQKVDNFSQMLIDSHNMNPDFLN